MQPAAKRLVKEFMQEDTEEISLEGKIEALTIRVHIELNVTI